MSEDTTNPNSSIQNRDDVLKCLYESGVFPDSKTFVDLRTVRPNEEIQEAFENLTANNKQPAKEKTLEFLGKYFEETGEFERWTPGDYNPEPDFLQRIKNSEYKNFVKDLVAIWPILARKVKPDVFENPENFSILPLPEGFIIPGGRFREIYYWDSLWIVEGLILSGMMETVKGILENFFFMVNTYGFIPNGSRAYYLNRSQPPLLALMVEKYMNQTNDLDWLKKNIKTIDKELNYWLDRFLVVEKNGKKYSVCRYISEVPTPRPESYGEDVNTASNYKDLAEKEKCYCELRSTAESGWDFSSRWIFDSDNYELHKIQITRVVPVDLNAMLCQAFGIQSKFYEQLGDMENSRAWKEKSLELEEAIEELLYNKEDGIWHDFDIKTNSQRKVFYASNFTPLWTESFDKTLAAEYGSRAVQYLRKNGILDLQGGIPCSLIQSGQQWDYPNAWPPLQSIVAIGLDKTSDPEAKKVAKELAEKWVDSNLIAFKETKQMFEKYDAVHPGKYGGGGEYTIQSGFGWSNGVVMSFIEHFNL